MKRILFCNIAYMQCYDFATIKEVPKHGGRYVAETGDAFEKHNFHKCEDGKFRGFVETKYIDGSASQQKPRQLRIENIDPAYKKADHIDDVTVVFCAHSDVQKSTIIVGWYNNATVYRTRPHYHGRQYNLECAAGDAYLLPEDMRTFIVPRASQSDFGFGQSNIWYAKEDRSSEYVDSVLSYIATHSETAISEDDTMPQLISEEYAESGIGKKVLVNKYERNPIARQRCLDIHGARCAICGFDSAAVYGDEFKSRIEVHHIVPIHEIRDDYKVDPEADLIPVCPNCHMILHIKMATGEYPSIDWLKNRISR